MISGTETEKKVILYKEKILKKYFSRTRATILEKFQKKMGTQVIREIRTKVCP